MNKDIKLIFHLNNHSFSYSIFNTIHNCFEKLQTHVFTHDKYALHHHVEKTIEMDGNLNNNYLTTLGVVDTHPSTFIPEALFDKKNLNQYVNLTYGKSQTTTQYIKQKFVNCYCVFSINNDLLLSLKSRFHNLNIRSTSSIFVDYSITLSKENNQELFAQIHQNYFHITLISYGNFKFYNKFYFDNTDDFIYYFINCIQTLKIKSNELEIYITSELEQNDPILEKLQEYLKIRFINRPSTFLYKDTILKSAPYKNHNLFSQLICE